jgi:hypothetical protein
MDLINFFIQSGAQPMFAEFGITAMIITSVVLAAASTAAAAAMTKIPGTPDLAAASRAGIEAEALTLADRRRMEAAAQQGIPVTVQTQPHTAEVPFVKVWKGQEDRGGLNGSDRGGFINTRSAQQQAQWVRYNPEDFKEGGKYGPESGYFTDNEIKNRKMKVPGSEVTIDFSGYGDADVQGKMARGMAEIQLELQKKFAPQFIEESRKALEQADPEGTQARSMAYDLIQQQMEDEPDRPVADLMDQQVGDELAAGNRLDGVMGSVLDDAVAQSRAARGGNAGGDFQSQFETGFAGEARRDAAQQKATSWLSSGATPEDVSYRRQQQNMANLGAFINGQSPVTQFQSLSGAQQGAAPFYQGQQLPGMNQGAGNAAQQFETQAWNTQTGAEADQANPWMAGLSSLLTAYGTYKKSGN